MIEEHTPESIMSLSMIVLLIIQLEICRNNNFNVIDLPINQNWWCAGLYINMQLKMASICCSLDGDIKQKDASSPSAEECEHGDWLVLLKIKVSNFNEGLEYFLKINKIF